MTTNIPKGCENGTEEKSQQATLKRFENTKQEFIKMYQ